MTSSTWSDLPISLSLDLVVLQAIVSPRVLPVSHGAESWGREVTKGTASHSARLAYQSILFLELRASFFSLSAFLRSPQDGPPTTVSTLFRRARRARLFAAVAAAAARGEPSFLTPDDLMAFAPGACSPSPPPTAKAAATDTGLASGGGPIVPSPPDEEAAREATQPAVGAVGDDAVAAGGSGLAAVRQQRRQRASLSGQAMPPAPASVGSCDVRVKFRPSAGGRPSVGRQCSEGRCCGMGMS